MAALSEVQGVLGSLVNADWAGEMQAWGEKVQLYRNYVDGKQRLELTSEMAKMLRISKDDDERFAVNYAELVVSKMADRLIVERVAAISPAEGDEAAKEANKWASALLTENRLDGMQIDAHEAALGDGDTFVMIDPLPLNDGAVYPALVHEPAFDGETGIIPIYDRSKRKLAAVVKIWEEGEQDYRTNIYYPGYVEKFDNGMELIERVPWLVDGQPIGVPFVHFRNRSRTARILGKSEIANMIPAQDVLNRTFMSMTMTAELTAFRILVFIGLAAQQSMSPGVIIEVVEKGVDGITHPGIPNDRRVDVKEIPVGEIQPFVQQAQFAIDQIGAVTETPLAQNMGSDASSGEALKQREAGLLSKARKAQIKFGNAWEEALMLAYRVQRAFGKEQPPEITRFNTVWQDMQVRNDAEVVDNAVKVREEIGQRKFLEIIAPVFGFASADIDKIIDMKAMEDGARLARVLGGSLRPVG